MSESKLHDETTPSKTEYDVLRVLDAVSSDEDSDNDFKDDDAAEMDLFNSKIANQQKDLLKQSYIPTITESVKKLSFSVCPVLPPGQLYAIVSILCKPYDQPQDAFSTMIIGTFSTLEEADKFMTFLVEDKQWRKFPMYIVKCGGFFSLPPPKPGQWSEEQKRYYGEKAKEVFGTLKKQTNDASNHIQARIQEGREWQEKRTKKAKKLMRRIHKLPNTADILPEGYYAKCKCVDVPLITGHKLKQYLDSVDPIVEYDANGVIDNVYPAVSHYYNNKYKVIYNEKFITALQELEKAGKSNPYKQHKKPQVESESKNTTAD